MNAETGVYGFLRNPSMVDFEGHLAAVFFTAGCNFRCGFCQNADLMSFKETTLSWDRLRNACRSFRRNWVDGVVLTGGEPTLLSNLDELLSFFKQEGFAVKLDTNGSRPDVLENVRSKVDYVAMDVKCALHRYPDFVGFAYPERIRQSLDLLKGDCSDYEFRTTVIPSIHGQQEVEDIAQSVSGASRHRLQPFIPREDLPDPHFRSESRTPPKQLKQVADVMDSYVEEVVVHGNTA